MEGKGTSITETPNEITFDLDIVSPIGFIRLLRQCDSQLFSGWREFAGFFDDSVLSTLTSFISCVRDLFTEKGKSDDVHIILSGAGTSGRLAFLIVRTFNKELKQLGYFPCFSYLIAGGDRALIVGIEGAEDDTKTSVNDLQKIIDEREAKKIVYIGITCGLSAPYVAAQLSHLVNLQKENKSKELIVSVLGFNPVFLARKTPIEGWNKSFYDVVKELDVLSHSNPPNRNFFIINPVIGPEALTGSTRMKGGTATKILLEVIFSSVFKLLFFNEPFKESESHPQNIKDTVLSLLQNYEQVYRTTYLHAEVLSTFIERAGESLKIGLLREQINSNSNNINNSDNNNGNSNSDKESEKNWKGHVYYVGSSTLGILGFIDASETVPTFGASLNEVRGFILDTEENVGNGWETLENKQGDLSFLGTAYKISQSEFLNRVLPTITNVDTVFLLSDSHSPNSNLLTVAKALSEKKEDKPFIGLISFQNSNGISKPVLCHQDFPKVESVNSDLIKQITPLVNKTLIVSLPFSHLLPHTPSFIEISLKYILNSISTGAFIQQGKVFQNRMIDVALTNNKLFYRAIGIVKMLSGVTMEEARLCVLRAIYNFDLAEIPQEIEQKSVSDHLKTVDSKQGPSNIVPISLILASKKGTVSDAILALKKDPIIRNILVSKNTE